MCSDTFRVVQGSGAGLETTHFILMLWPNFRETGMKKLLCFSRKQREHEGQCESTAPAAPSASHRRYYLFFPEGTLRFRPHAVAVSHHHKVLVLLLLFVGRAGKWVDSRFLSHKFFSVCLPSLKQTTQDIIRRLFPSPSPQLLR